MYYVNDNTSKTEKLLTGYIVHHHITKELP